MENETPILQCPNYSCQALNPENHRFCQNCRTPLPKRYLWITGGSRLKPGDRCGTASANDGLGRYCVKHDRIALDTRPGELPEMPSDIAPEMEPYLRLFSHRLWVPQLYAVVQKRGQDAILLLEQSAIYPDGSQSATGADLTGTLMPSIVEVWQQSSALRQLALLWQIAQLWQPLSLEKVTSTLLDMALVRVDGGTVRLLELKPDRAKTPTLVDLGQVWSQWQAQPEIAGFFSQICQGLIQGKIGSSEHLIESLDHVLTVQGQRQVRRIEFATFSDRGPSRERNEDACHPSSGTRTSSDQTLPLVIVCDGIGGHEGGEIASQLAIEIISAQANQISGGQSAAIVTETLTEAVLNANDVISQRNDEEERQERQRMGTTVVMGLAHAHELYIAHVGDSRAYRITRTGCYQVTLDDDVASRQVRLGYTIYRSALQQPSAGSLVQALGMGESDYLHPTVQRFVLDEDCVFLLCSDGLSDHDRVEEFWQTEILPILDGKDVATVAQRLVEIANTYNGHDNVTVGVIQCQVKETETVPIGAPMQAIPATAGQSMGQSTGQSTQVISPSTTLQPDPAPPSKTALVTPTSRPWLKIFLSLFGLLGIGSVLALLLVPEIRNTISYRPLPSPSPIAAVPASPSASPQPTLTVGSWVQVKPSETGVELLDTANSATTPTPDVGRRVPSGTILQVEETLKNPSTWLKLKVCHLGTPVSPTTQWKEGQSAWQQESTIAPLVEGVKSPPEQLGECARSTPASPSTANPTVLPSP